MSFPTESCLTAPLRWLYIDFNSYFASVEQQLNPEFRGKPVAVVPVETDSTCAIAASYEAKAYGIKTGTPIYEAKRMCKDLICVLGRHEHYVEHHHRIQEEVERHLPLSMVCSIDEVACRLMDNETSLARVTEIAEAIKEGLAANVGEYVKCSIGVAPNRYLAKVATDLEKPDGFVILQPQDILPALEKLELRDLPGIGRNMEKRLNMQGIWTMKQLLALDTKRMRKAWGNIWGERLWYMLRGIELPEEQTTRSSIGHSHVLAPELRPTEQARHVLRRLTIKAASRLRRMEYYATAMGISLRLESGERLAAEAHCYQAQDNLTFLKLLDEMWKQLTSKHAKARFRKVSITLHGLQPADARQADLFGETDDLKKLRAKGEKLSHAMDKLNKRYGRDTLQIGMTPPKSKENLAPKVAFTRIPDIQEFYE